MKAKFRSSHVLPALLALSTLHFSLSTAHAQATAFAYQGQLYAGGASAAGSYDFAFALYDSAQNGNQIGPSLTNSAVGVTNGLFTITLDFGGGIFTGSNYWLDLSVRTNDTGAFTELAPRQPAMPVPYASFANSASNLLGPLPAASLSGTYASPVTLNNANNSLTGLFTGDGGGLTNLNLSGSGALAPSAAFYGTNQGQIFFPTINPACTYYGPYFYDTYWTHAHGTNSPADGFGTNAECDYYFNDGTNGYYGFNSWDGGCKFVVWPNGASDPSAVNTNQPSSNAVLRVGQGVNGGCCYQGYIYIMVGMYSLSGTYPYQTASALQTNNCVQVYGTNGYCYGQYLLGQSTRLLSDIDFLPNGQAVVGTVLNTQGATYGGPDFWPWTNLYLYSTNVVTDTDGNLAWQTNGSLPMAPPVVCQISVKVDPQDHSTIYIYGGGSPFTNAPMPAGAGTIIERTTNGFTYPLAQALPTNNYNTDPTIGVLWFSNNDPTFAYLLESGNGMANTNQIIGLSLIPTNAPTSIGYYGLSASVVYLGPDVNLGTPAIPISSVTASNVNIFGPYGALNFLGTGSSMGNLGNGTIGLNTPNGQGYQAGDASGHWIKLAPGGPDNIYTEDGQLYLPEYTFIPNVVLTTGGLTNSGQPWGIGPGGNATFTNLQVNGSQTTTGNIMAASFTGNGAGLTSLSASAMTGGLTINLAVLVPAGGTNTLCFTNGILTAIQ